MLPSYIPNWRWQGFFFQIMYIYLHKFYVTLLEWRFHMKTIHYIYQNIASFHSIPLKMKTIDCIVSVPTSSVRLKYKNLNEFKAFY